MPISSTTIILADTQDLISNGIKYLFSHQKQYQLISTVGTQKDLWQVLETAQPDLLIIDYLNVRNLQVEDLQQIKGTFPAVQILIITADKSKENILKALKIGVIGFLTKDCSSEEVLQAICSVMDDKKFYCQRVLEFLMEERVAKEEKSMHQFSAREMQVIRLIAKGKSTQEIADVLCLSFHTINSHRKNILKKLKVKSPVELVVKAIEMGLITPNSKS
ncbi:response regulator transcription factor [Rapidithrix thailandica]|uniref:Response regulator transcription factor n=1 Tax=Rapidithrix thailandica TaxID=413964 RepID=A0AAW9S3W8_9BACT